MNCLKGQEEEEEVGESSEKNIIPTVPKQAQLSCTAFPALKRDNKCSLELHWLITTFISQGRNQLGYKHPISLYRSNICTLHNFKRICLKMELDIFNDKY